MISSLRLVKNWQARMNKIMKNKTLRPGRILLGAIAGITAVAGFAADWNRTHLFNPDWPPHAKFHDAWSISLGSLLGASGIYFLLRRSGDGEQNLKLGTILPAFYWISQGASFAFPGAEGLEAEFPELVPRIKGIWLNEKTATVMMLSLSSIGYILEYRSR